MVLVFMSDNIVPLHIKYKSVKSFINDVLSNEPLLLRFDKKISSDDVSALWDNIDLVMTEWENKI